MEKIEIGNGLMVKVPDGSCYHFIYEECLLWLIGTQEGELTLPSGQWSILSLKSEMTEEKAREVVESVEVAGGNMGRDFGYVNYSEDAQHDFNTALESFQSFCTANNLKGEYVVLIKK